MQTPPLDALQPATAQHHHPATMATQQAEQATAPQSTIPAAVPTTKQHEEHQYLDLIRRILSEGEVRPDRYSPPLPSRAPQRQRTEN